MCLYVCIYECMYVCRYLCVGVCVYMYMCMCVYVCVYDTCTDEVPFSMALRMKRFLQVAVCMGILGMATAVR